MSNHIVLAELGDADVPLHLATDELSLLAYAMREAVERKLTAKVSEATAEAA